MTASLDVPKVVSVIGGGRMGAGIAQIFAAAGAVGASVEGRTERGCTPVAAGWSVTTAATRCRRCSRICIRSFRLAREAAARTSAGSALMVMDELLPPSRAARSKALPAECRLPDP